MEKAVRILEWQCRCCLQSFYTPIDKRLGTHYCPYCTQVNLKEITQNEKSKGGGS